MGPQGHDSSAWHTHLADVPLERWVEMELYKWSPILPAMWELISEGASVGRDAGTRTSWAPRELTVVYLLASTIDMYLNHRLLTITQQRLFSETLQTALFYLALSNLDVPLLPPLASPDSAS